MKKARDYFKKTSIYAVVISLVLTSPGIPAQEIIASSFYIRDESRSSYQSVISPDNVSLVESVETETSESENFLIQSPLTPMLEEESNVEAEAVVPDDPFFDSSIIWNDGTEDLWWLKRVKADQAWDYTMGEGSLIAVIDTGIDFDHPDIKDNIWRNESELNGVGGADDNDPLGLRDDFYGWDYSNGDNDPTDDHGHGTHVAGIAAGQINNGEGIVGIAPKSKILPLKVLDERGSGNLFNIQSAIRYAVAMGADVINMSLGATASLIPGWILDSTIRVMQEAIDAGVILVAAGGNSARLVEDFFPANMEGIIAVGATEPDDDLAWFSNYGEKQDITAPGHNILSLRASGTGFGGSVSGFSQYALASGTSMAAPIVSGVVALMRSLDPDISLSDVMRRLKYSAIDLGAAGVDLLFGPGLVNALDAVSKDYYDDGKLKTYWLSSADENNVVRFDYDTETRVSKRTLENGSTINILYWPNTGNIFWEEFLNADGEFEKKIEYYEDGVTKRRESFANGEVIEYDREGNPLKPQIQGEVFDRQQLTAFPHDIRILQAEAGARFLEKFVFSDNLVDSLVYDFSDGNTAKIILRSSDQPFVLPEEFVMGSGHPTEGEASVSVTVTDSSGVRANYILALGDDLQNFLLDLSDSVYAEEGFDRQQVVEIEIEMNKGLSASNDGSVYFVFPKTETQFLLPTFRHRQFSIPVATSLTLGLVQSGNQSVSLALGISRFLEELRKSQLPPEPLEEEANEVRKSEDKDSDRVRMKKRSEKKNIRRLSRRFSDDSTLKMFMGYPLMVPESVKYALLLQAENSKSQIFKLLKKYHLLKFAREEAWMQKHVKQLDVGVMRLMI